MKTLGYVNAYAGFERSRSRNLKRAQSLVHRLSREIGSFQTCAKNAAQPRTSVTKLLLHAIGAMHAQRYLGSVKGLDVEIQQVGIGWSHLALEVSAARCRRELEQKIPHVGSVNARHG